MAPAYVSSEIWPREGPDHERLRAAAKVEVVCNREVPGSSPGGPTTQLPFDQRAGFEFSPQVAGIAKPSEARQRYVSWNVPRSIHPLKTVTYRLGSIPVQRYYAACGRHNVNDRS